MDSVDMRRQQSEAAAGTTVPPAVRATILATEHWSLLGTRSMTWSEIMSRITILLTVSSATLVVLAVVAQADGFGTTFQILSIGLTAAVLVLGTLTGIRVDNASLDDAALIAGMNRLRAAYIEMDPGVERYLLASTHDDQAGVMATYLMGNRRPMLLHIVGSTNFFVSAFNALVCGALGALIAWTIGWGTAGIVVAGLVCGVGYVAAMAEVGRRTLGQFRIESRFPTEISTGAAADR